MRYKFKTTPYKHQALATKIAATQPNTALLLDPGLGKTKIAIDNLGIRNMRDGLSRVLVLAPKVVLGTWEEEINTHLPDNINRWIYRIKGSKEYRMAILENAISNSQVHPKDLHVVVMTYDSLAVRKGSGGTKYDEYFKLMKKFKPQAIVCDESQLIKTHSSKRSRAAYTIGKEANHRLILTGTMITKNPLDVFGQYRFLDDRIFGTRWTDFKNRYAIFGGFTGHQIIGYNNLDELAKLTHQIAIRMRKEECLDLPEKSFQIVPVEFEDKTRKIYKGMQKDMITELQGQEFTADIAMVKALRLQQICGGFISKTEDDNRITIPTGEYEKMEATVELAQLRMEAGHKVVIYAKYIWELKQLYDRFQKLGNRPLMIYGGSKDDYVDRAKYLFQNNPSYPILLMQVSKGIGVTLTSADIGIFYSLSHKYDDFLQCQDRLHRIGQKNNVTYYIMLIKDSIDYHIYKSVLAKQDFSKYIQDHQYTIFNE